MEVDFFSPITQELGFLVSKGPGSQEAQRVLTSVEQDVMPSCSWPPWGTTQAVAVLLCGLGPGPGFLLPLGHFHPLLRPDGSHL